LSWPVEKILAEVEIQENQVKQIKFDLAKMCWYMRGSLSMSEAYDLAPDEREVISNLIKENLETAKKTGQPFF
tara:strand:- start:649 stop:867 length:219 start_codon:yes stop_codon:yes gene_type:complete